MGFMGGVVVGLIFGAVAGAAVGFLVSAWAAAAIEPDSPPVRLVYRPRLEEVCDGH